MGLLAPLYVAGFLAIGLPILFHLIRRAPQGRQVFSSLMFLSASPPRLTKRSRLTNILLLILRATAFILLALAFARPFLEWGGNLEAFQTSGRRMALLIDTSASMQRGDLWHQATTKAEEVLGGVSPKDEVALYFFDGQVHPAFTFEEWNQTGQGDRIAMLKTQLAAAKPGWQATKLGDALATVADFVGESVGAPKGIDKVKRQVVLISDLQKGSRAETLQGHQWPAGVELDVKAVALKQASNASLQWAKQTAGEEESVTAKADTRLRVRINNEADSTREQFTISWANEGGIVPGMEPVKAYVAPGRSQMVRMDWPTEGQKADRLVLAGDDCDFDNTLYLVPPHAETVRVVYFGDDAPDDVKGMRYYLESALSETPLRKMEWIGRPASESIRAADLLNTRLVVVTAALTNEDTDRLKQYIESGGSVLWAAETAGAAKGAERLGMGDWKVEEASGNFALLGRVDMSHPLFAPFADARFSDFTKIHFWKHRRVTLPEASPPRVLASFDNGDPFLLERTLGRGTLRVMTSGWQPADSQLALSTKFVPLMEGILKGAGANGVGDSEMGAQYAVGDAIALPPEGTQIERSGRAVIGPDGARTELATTATSFTATDKPGIYRLIANGQETPLAVNLPVEESRTAPMGVEELERWGAKLGESAGKTASAEPATAMRERRLKTAELENRQKLWRWLIVGVLGLLAAETALAGRLAHRALKQQATS